jgi:hypothetical protein
VSHDYEQAVKNAKEFLRQGDEAHWVVELTVMVTDAGVPIKRWAEDVGISCAPGASCRP